MANEVYATVRNCESDTRMSSSQHKLQLQLELIPTTWPLDFVLMKILVPFPKTKDGNQYLLLITNRYTKLKRATPATKPTAPHVAAIFLVHWTFPYGIPTYLLTYNGPQFVCKLFAALCSFFEAKTLTMTAYHPQTNGQTEWYNKYIVSRLHHYVA